MKKQFYLLFCLFGLGISTLQAQKVATISEKTASFKKYTGYFNFYWDEANGKIFLEIDKFDTEFLYVNSLPAGLKSAW